MKVRFLALLLLAASIASPAEARHRKPEPPSLADAIAGAAQRLAHSVTDSFRASGAALAEAARRAPEGLGEGRPREWCGWYMRQQKHEPDTAYNLARNWAHWGHAAAGPHSGVVVVWAHHVGEIVAGECPAGSWMVESGNDENQVQTRCRPITGAIAFRE